jgi:hypothetical protein
MMKTFKHRYVVLTERAHIIKDSVFTVKSYENYSEASRICRAANKRFNTYSNIIDTKTHEITEDFCVFKKKSA